MASLTALLGAAEELPGDRVVLFVFVTLGLLVLSVALVKFLREHSLIVLGLLIAAAAVGYGLVGSGLGPPNVSIGAPTVPGPTMVFTSHVSQLAGTLMKIAVVLVLAGVARSLWTWPSESVSNTPRP